MAAKKEDRVPKGSRKSLNKMSEAHRTHVLFWEDHLENLKAEFVWIAVSRFSERGGQGKHYVAIKRGEKDYAIVDYDTANPKPVTKKNVLDEGFTSSTAMMEAFKQFRQLARDERAASAAVPKPATKPKVRKTTTAPKKTAPKTPAAKKAAAPKAAAKKPTRKRTPAKSK